MIDESWYIKPDGISEEIAAGGVVTRLVEGKVWVALVREGNYLGYFLPKGGVENGEELETSARREIEEEAGLTNLQFIKELGVKERFTYQKSAWKVTHYFLFITKAEGGIPTDSEHSYRCDWYPLDKLPSLFWPEQKDLLEKNRALITALTISAFSSPANSCRPPR